MYTCYGEDAAWKATLLMTKDEWVGVHGSTVLCNVHGFRPRSHLNIIYIRETWFWT